MKNPKIQEMNMKVFKICEGGVHLWTSLDHCLCGELQWGANKKLPTPQRTQDREELIRKIEEWVDERREMGWGEIPISFIEDYLSLLKSKKGKE